MKRVMIVGQPGSGKSTLARALGDITGLPVVHIDRIHWKSGWVARPDHEKDALCAEVHARERWIFEGGRSPTWPERIARADTLVWLDPPFALRVWRVFRRTVTHFGRQRADLPEGCADRLDGAFWRYIWESRHTQREKMRVLYETAPAGKAKHRLTGRRDVERYLDGLRGAS